MIEEESVYVRTEEGESRARQPRSIASHELRAMLLLVDGRLSVRELKRRFGASLAIDTATEELLRLGWIQPEGETAGIEMDFVGAEIDAEDAVETAPPDIVSADLADAAEGTEVSGNGAERDAPVDFDLTPDDASIGATPEPSMTTADGSADTRVSEAEPPVAADEQLDAPARVEPAAPAADEVAPYVPGDPREPVIATGEFPPDVALPAPTPIDGVRGPNLADRTRGGMIATRFFLGRMWRAFLPLAAIAAVAALVVAAFLLPERHRPEIEAALAHHVGAPVSFGSMRLSAFGGGSLELSDLRVATMPSLRAEGLYLTPDWPASIRAVAWRFKASLVGLEARADALSRLLAANTVREDLSGIHVADAAVRIGPERWGGFTGDVSFDHPGAVTLVTPDNAVRATLNANGDALGVDVVAINRALGVFPKLTMDSYQLVGTLRGDGLDISRFEAAVFSGKASATGRLDFAQGAQLEVDLTLGKIDARRLMNAVGSSVRLEGAVDGQFALSAAGVQTSAISVAKRIEGRFSIDNGVLRGMDFAAALRERGTGKIQGGETRFETLSGKIDYDGERTLVTLERLAAGALDANGRVEVGKLDSLSGKVGATVVSGGRRVRVPITVSGSLAAPVLETPKPAAPPSVAASEGGENTEGAPQAEGADKAVPVEAPDEAFEIPVGPGDLRQ
ncbi:hypothetical protein G3580_08870 [Nitrogeniibacter mangrovi]|uniref:Uncharacterized protein n=1 Tax=Nitrogeniibacter mangrovi TaxID=2016596 RepID=A0A6C1B2F4_9RHOO|nr:AsmA-like C-terminal region-containing protein [Nitrogeniibacter mangrovi]QID17747.1 hypothetical protein G3580_08870 [Nitrogeniibacter mangrovi]